MKSYELTYAISSNLSQDQANAKVKEIESFIRSKEGVVLNSGRVSIQTLAYPIKKYTSAYFGSLTFQISEDKVKEIKDKLEKSNEILRHFILVKKPFRVLKPARSARIFKKPLLKTIRESVFTKAADSEEVKEVDVKEIDKKLDELLNE